MLKFYKFIEFVVILNQILKNSNKKTNYCNPFNYCSFRLSSNTYNFMTGIILRSVVKRITIVKI